MRNVLSGSLIEVHDREVDEQQLDLFDEAHSRRVLGQHAHEEAEHHPPAVGYLRLWNPAQLLVILVLTGGVAE